MANIKLQLKAKHFEGTFFCLGQCAIEKSYYELAGHDCKEMVSRLIDSYKGKVYGHERYNAHMFNSDRDKAETHNWDETVIRTIELIEG